MLEFVPVRDNNFDLQRIQQYLLKWYFVALSLLKYSYSASVFYNILQRTNENAFSKGVCAIEIILCNSIISLLAPMGLMF